MSDLMERYVACWNETDAQTRRTLLALTWAEDASYVDPLADVAGLDGIDAVIAAVQQQFPGFVFSPVAAIDEHHSQARFQWGLGPAGAEPVVIGFDVVVTGEDGRIASVYGFLDKVPA
jgi:hypothetical protein